MIIKESKKSKNRKRIPWKKLSEVLNAKGPFVRNADQWKKVNVEL